MKSLRSLILFFVGLCSSLFAAADELTVTSITSNSQDGIVITFSHDVKVTHSMFGTKCYVSIIDNDAAVKNLNATPSTKGNVVTLTPAYCTFVNGHHMVLELDPACFTTLDGTATLTGDTTFEFVMGDGIAADPITALLVSPSNGMFTRLGNIAVVFSPTISAVLDPEGYTIVNENGHSLPILNVAIDDETSIHALNVNVDPERVTLQEGTTYSLHIAPGALRCGTITNDTELVYGKWYVKPSPLVLVTEPADQRMVENLHRVVISAENGERLSCTNLSTTLTITGIMNEQTTVYATSTSIRPVPDGTAYIVLFDNTITPEWLAEQHPSSNNIKLTIPEGLFTQGAKTNDRAQSIWLVEHPAEIGEVTWNFDPKPGTTLEALGRTELLDGLDGEVVEYTSLRFSITGENAYMTAPDATAIRIVNEDTGATVMTFGRGDVRSEVTNEFVLRMSHQIVECGTYTLIIPASAVNYHSDEQHYSEPKHPLVDIEASWEVFNDRPTAVAAPLSPDAHGMAPAYDLQGRPVQHTRSGIVIRHGRKHLQ